MKPRRWAYLCLVFFLNLLSAPQLVAQQPNVGNFKEWHTQAAALPVCFTSFIEVGATSDDKLGSFLKKNQHARFFIFSYLDAKKISFDTVRDVVETNDKVRENLLLKATWVEKTAVSIGFRPTLASSLIGKTYLYALC